MRAVVALLGNGVVLANTSVQGGQFIALLPAPLAVFPSHVFTPLVLALPALLVVLFNGLLFHERRSVPWAIQLA